MSLKITFVKLWDFLGHYERTQSKRPTCQILAFPDINSSLYFLSPHLTPILSVHADYLWLQGKEFSNSAQGLFTFSHKLCNDCALKNSIFISCPTSTRMVMAFVVNTTKISSRGAKFHQLKRILSDTPCPKRLDSLWLRQIVVIES